jgi:diguanylate cyclase (GGDEF)-like protein
MNQNAKSPTTETPPNSDFFRKLFESSYDAIFVEKLDGQIIDVNQAACNFLKYTRQELLEMNAADQSLAGYNICKDGTRRHVEIKKQSFRQKDEQYLIVFVRDITEQSQASEDKLSQQFNELLSNRHKILHQNEVLDSLHHLALSLMNRLDLDDVLRQVVTSATKLVNTEHGFIYLIDEESGLFERKIGLGLYANDIGRKAKSTDGLVSEILSSGKLMIINDYSTWKDRLPEPLFDNIHNIVQVPLKIANQVIGTFGLALQDKERNFSAEEIDLLNRFAELAAIALDNAALVTSYKQEIIERKQTETLLRISEENNQTLINALPDTLLILNRQGMIIDFRGNDRQLLYLSKKAVGKNIAEVIPSATASKMQHHIKAALETDTIQVFNHELSKAEKTQYYEARIIRSGKKEEVLAIIRDTTKKVRMEKHLERLSLHDSLTGLYNRAFFEKEMLRISATPTTAIGFLVCDIDGLKFINDSLGNQAGDAMLKTVATILKAVFSSKDVIARIGGDEFAVLLSPRSLQYIDGLCQNIRMQIERYNVENSTIPISLSMGFSCSKQPPFIMKQLLSEADNIMYREKLHRQKSTRSAIVHALLKALEARDFITEGHGDRLQSLMESFAGSLGIPGRNMADLILFSQFHDIGKVGIPDQILFKPAKLTAEEFTVMRQHCEIGYNIAKSAPDLVPIANWILRHHEWWNGKGYPFGLTGEDIPLACRMLSIIDAFDAMTNDRPYRKALPCEHALQELKKFSGSQFDPNLVKPFVTLIQRDFVK